MNNKPYAYIVTGLQAGLTLVVVAVLITKAISLRSQISFEPTAHTIVMILISIALCAVFYGLLALHWLVSLRVFNKQTQPKLLLAFYASQPYKYLPTSLFTFSLRSKFAKDLGVPIATSAKAQLIENLNLIACAFGLSLLTLGGIWHWCWAAVLVLVGSIFLYVLHFYNFTIAKKIKGRQYRLETRQLVPMIALATLAWLVAGLALWILSTATNGSADVLTTVAANSLAFGAGILAVFAPGGIGVRELIYNHFGIMVSVIVAWRLLTLVFDVLTGFTAVAIVSRIKTK